MAKKQEKTSRRSGGKTEPAVGAKGHTAGAVPSRRKMMAGRKGLRRRLHKLEGQLADAARQERKRLRRLERALWRRQRIEAAIDEIKTATALVKNAAAAEAAKPAEAKPVVAKPVAKNAAAKHAAAKPAARRPAARSAAAKPVATRRAAAKPAAPASTQEVTTVTAETPAPSAPPRPVRTRRAPVKRVAQPRSNGAAASPRPPIEAEPAPVPPTQS
jgi:hypothetical protein